jgi:hypothetical protein
VAVAEALAMYRHVLVILTALILSACGQSEPPAKGDARSARTPGPAGPPGADSGAQAPAIKVIARPCDQVSCGASCEENEQIINAYALNPGGVIAFVDERHVTFRTNKRPTILVLVCIGR